MDSFGGGGLTGNDATSPTTTSSSSSAAAAASRQKSCNACVRGKRRCDKRTPRCSRCANKGLDCVYQKMPPGAGRDDHLANHAPNSHSHVRREHQRRQATMAEPVSASEVPEFDMSFDMEPLTSDTSPESLQADVGLLGGADGLDFSIVDMLASSSASGTDVWSLHGFGGSGDDGYGSKMDLPPLPTGPFAAPMTPALQQPPPIRDLSLLKANDRGCVDFDPLHVHDPRTRLGCIVAFMSTLPATFATTRALPFMHPRLWVGQVPKPILTVYSAASAYANGNGGGSGKAWTVKLVADASRDIHREGERAATPADKLARVQALTIAGAMRVFDGDVGLRAAAEREMSVLMAWTKELATLRDELEEEAAMQKGGLREAPPKTWESWIFLESVRRTVMAASAFMCVFVLLKSEEPDDDMWCKRQTFTASKHLWDATSSVEFYRSWRDKPQYWIENMSFTDFWMYGRPADLDEFTRLMLISQVGVDAMDHFLEGEIAIPV
ncbi:hypothetical protein HIM_03868 [Hirsutella minnesotensis 3608]|uniref:Zn(2)-C6 fungal-type domain-containing protein n=1 Tax=Hirsutella minnesotensis 3608 TaxID=1043627 RepID=A0A0F8A1V2_9HYPO|nr:hypothetical protein HIM_03868 [Hirsutella minnesotensis 3608]